jgi:PAS domain S-box-containing protein
MSLNRPLDSPNDAEIAPTVLRMLLDVLPLGVFLRDEQGRVLLVNQLAARRFGRTPEEMLGKTPHELYAAERILATDRKVLADGQAIEREERHMLADGKLHTMFTGKVRVQFADGRFGVLGFGLDVTARREAEDALREQTELLARIFDADPSFIVLKDAEGRYLMANRAFQTWTGRSLDTLRELKAHELARSDTEREQIAAHEAHARAAGEAVTREEHYVRLDGSASIVEATRIPMKDALGREQMLVVSRDVTAARRREAELEAARQRADQANRAKDAFLANMSHELRTPMHGVLGSLALLAGMALNDEQRRLVDIARRSGQHLLGVIDDVLDYSKIEAGGLTLDEHAVDIGSLAQEVVQSLALIAQGKGIELRADLDAALPRTLRADAQRLRQVFINLLGNALKFTDRGQICLELRVEAGVVECSVRDTGIGMTDEQMARIFEPFVQADDSIGKRFGGTGLGLSISRRLLQSMGCELRVQSALGQGACFSFRLPLRPASDMPMAPPRAADRLTELPALRLLLVEDQALNRMVSHALLVGMGHDVLLAEDGETALNLLGQTQVDCVLMDLQMPVMDGLTAVRHLRDQERAASRAHMPVIALTAHALPEHRAQCMAAGMDGYLTKPFTRESLQGELLEVLGARLAPR